MPPGYLGLSLPPALRVLQHGVCPYLSGSLPMRQLIQIIPAVIGSVKSASFERAVFSDATHSNNLSGKELFSLPHHRLRRAAHPVSSVFLYGSFHLLLPSHLRHIPAAP